MPTIRLRGYRLPHSFSSMSKATSLYRSHDRCDHHPPAVRSRIAGESELPPQNFEIQTDAGIVTIHAKAVSLDQAAKVINLALSVPDVRQIVYRMPLSSWRTAGR